MEKIRRSTPLKMQILGLLKDNHFLSASQIADKLHQAGNKVNKTSIYRNLETFLADGLICQQAFANEFVYELEANHHDHIHCNTCGKVEEISCQVLENPQVAGYTVGHHHLTLYGTCADCQKASH